MFPFNCASRREAVIILVLSFFGAWLRFRGFWDIGLTHFDEGIYALAGLWSVAPKGLASLDPELIAYAPPGVPILIGLAYLAFGVADSSALIVSAVCGVLTVPVAGWIGRRTFGPGAGAAASAFAAMSIADVDFSRKALTDSPFLLCWLVAIGLGQRFLETPRLGRALAMGVAVGVAQNIKYNGWLAGALVALTAVLGVIARRDERRVAAIARTFGFGLVGACVAILVYAPWYGFVETHGGYASLLRHQRAYLGGFSEWYPHWKLQLAQAVALSGGLYWGIATWCAAWIGCAWVAYGNRLVIPGMRWGGAVFRIGLLGGATLLAGMADFPWWAGLASLPWLLFNARPAARLIGASWLVLSILTPFYHPYARLWLPIHAAGWLIVAGLIERIGHAFGELNVPVGGHSALKIWDRNRVRLRVLALVACVCVGLMRGGDTPYPLPFANHFRPTTGFRDIAADLALNLLGIPTDQSIGFRTLARRSLVFYLVVQTKFPVRIEPNPQFLLEPPNSEDWALIDEAVLDDYPGQWSLDFERLSRFRSRIWRTRNYWESELDPVTLLDVSPEIEFREWSGFQRRPAADVWLLKPSR